MVQQLTELDQEVDKIIGKYQGDRSALIQVLIEVQREKRWLPKDALKQVSQRLGVALTQIYHIATFYKAFSLKPRGRHSVTVCLGTACQVRGAPRLLDNITQTLKIDPDETSADEQFSLDTARCLGCCAIGPVMVVDGEYYGKPSRKEIDQIISAKEIET
ncbi:MAG TPA: NAD(P)H-dependent oxidoreductase subunit E [Dehalococcoidia bacterium]|nr:NAD(P)H-dependent oxidoreductase subunit E [Dehalococcoidia bacterium]